MTSREIKYLLLIAIIFIAACIETDIYLPAFPDMMSYFKVSEDAIQHLLTINFIGICASGCFYGPTSDVLGRKKPLLIALGLFLLGSIITLFSHHFSLMLVGRFFQGLGSGGCFTLGTAIIFDTFKKEKALQANNYLNASIPFIMAAAPIAGGYLNHHFGFHSNFLLIAVLVLISFLICLFFLEETLPIDNRQDLKIAKIQHDFKTVLLNMRFWQIILVLSLIFSAYMTFISNISVLFVIELGVSKNIFPLYQASILIVWLAGSMTCNIAIKKWGAPTLKKFGVVLLAVGGIWAVAIMLLAPHSPLGFTMGMLFFTLGANWINGLYFPEGMELFPEIKGVVASLLTTIRLLITSFIVALVSSFYNATIYPIGITLVCILFLVLPIIVFYERSWARQAPSSADLSED
ncbi:MAG: multidrug effflux MFS transporter [Simkaniaceae bacterium]|nr:multidrug effflux MFS transporter [Simkaniaceae bacterium]MCF7852342.1 multidrug effflux MFS transporter [Simkaniaceae bacterium]